MDQNEINKLLKKFQKEETLSFLNEDTIEFEPTIEEIIKVLRSKRIDILDGTAHKEFEKQFAEWLSCKHAIFVSSGTAALFCALRAKDIGPGDEVIVPPFTFMATASCVLHTNAMPVFADIEMKTYNLDPNDAIAKITDKTKAIIPVHLAGMPADIGPLVDVCKEKNIFLLEDACQSHGAKYNGKYVGTIGDAGCFSFFPSKNMTTGEGGMITTDDDELAEQCRIIRHHGESSWYVFSRLGWHLRPTELQAAIGIAQMKVVKSNIRKRQQAWFYLNDQLKDVPGIKVPDVPEYAEPSCNWWGGMLEYDKVGMESAQQMVNALNKKNAFTKILYPEPLYMTKVFQEGDSFLPFKMPKHERGECPICEEVNQRLIGIDTHQNLTKAHCDFIVDRFKAVASGEF
ncbi:MAG TPA: DegT/DnrJ/EryC1/StrS family aminotransferase [Candidatus Lokiarchaeia archaeon]|nr:DegT/DnrJ/EryC1/StrS family aminotransferase [Candidatus Lokiarchaeia archaeon]